MIFHRCLQKIHSGKSLQLFFRCKKHDHCCTAADHDRIDKYPKCLYQSGFDRLSHSAAAAAQGAEPDPASFEKSPLLIPFISTAPNPPAATCGIRMLPERSFQKLRKTSDIPHNDQNRDCKIAYRHNRHYKIQYFHSCILTQYDHSRKLQARSSYRGAE